MRGERGDRTTSSDRSWAASLVVLVIMKWEDVSKVLICYAL
jgi:hypothetical protein